MIESGTIMGDGGEQKDLAESSIPLVNAANTLAVRTSMLRQASVSRFDAASSASS
jgi:hypothetical protein